MLMDLSGQPASFIKALCLRCLFLLLYIYTDAAHMPTVSFVMCRKREFYLLTSLDRFALMVLRGNKIAEPKREERFKWGPSSPTFTTVPPQVVKVKNSRGGQEGSEGPGVATADCCRACLPLLFSAE